MKDKYGNEHDENNGQFTSNGSTAAENKRADEITDSASKKNKMTPAEKMASVHIDPSKDTTLPELNENDLIKLGLNINKKVLIKASTIARNDLQHKDVSPQNRDKIIAEALYNPSEIFKGNKEKPYYTFVKPLRLSPKDGLSNDNGLVLLDVDARKENFEVVHWHWISQKNLERMKNNFE